MGSKTGWLGDSCIPFFVWLAAVAHRRPHFIIHECTPRFDGALFVKVLGDMYDIQSTCLSPTDCGIPSSRERRYTVMTLKTHIRVKVFLDSEQFKQMFFRRVMLDGSVYMDGLSQEVWDDHISEMAVKVGLPPRDVSGPWPLPAVLPPGLATRMLGWNALARERGIMRGFCDAEQTSHFGGNIQTVMPSPM